MRIQKSNNKVKYDIEKRELKMDTKKLIVYNENIKGN